MSHYYIEKTPLGQFAVKVAHNHTEISTHSTQEEALAAALRLNPNDHPDVSRVRNTAFGHPDQWRSAR